MRLLLLLRDLFDVPLPRHQAYMEIARQIESEDDRSTLIISRQKYSQEAE